ncbi:MAG TPA: biosynthetic peptidoglycan transglycosylase, partial [Acetobacteraceae bacterium]
MARAPSAAPTGRFTGRPAPGARQSGGDKPGAAGPALLRRWAWRVFRWLVIAWIWGALGGALVLFWFARDLPRPETALDAARRPGLTLQDRSGRSFATFGDVVGDSLRLRDMPKWLPAAAVAVEDRRFYHHLGVDPVGIARAIYTNLRYRRVSQGGSTITQQVAKNLFLTNARTFRRKVQELMLTLWLEHSFTKTEILEIWLNRVYLGSGAWGMDAAAR